MLFADVAALVVGFSKFENVGEILRACSNKGVMVIVAKGEVMTVMDEDEVVRFYNVCLSIRYLRNFK